MLGSQARIRRRAKLPPHLKRPGVESLSSSVARTNSTEEARCHSFPAPTAMCRRSQAPLVQRGQRHSWYRLAWKSPSVWKLMALQPNDRVRDECRLRGLAGRLGCSPRRQPPDTGGPRREQRHTSPGRDTTAEAATSQRTTPRLRPQPLAAAPACPEATHRGRPVPAAASPTACPQAGSSGSPTRSISTPSRCGTSGPDRPPHRTDWPRRRSRASAALRDRQARPRLPAR